MNIAKYAAVAVIAVGAAGWWVSAKQSGPMVSSIASPAVAAVEVEVYKSATCGCCNKWVDHMRNAGYKVITHDTEQLDQYKKMVGVPDDMQSCHTAKVGGYIIEGHVPAKEIMRLLREKPKARGLAVPGMVSGSPGMEGGAVEKYNVMLFGIKNNKNQIYASY